MAGRCGCEKACTCCSSPSSSIAVSGSGSAGQCHTYEVRYSTDPGNRARPGGDGGVFTDLCVLDPAGDPLEPDGQACVQIPAPVIRTYGSGPSGTVVTPNPDGSVTLPTSGAPPDYGCGLTTGDDDELVVATSGAWPPNDLSGSPLAGAYTEGSEIACGPDGQLRGVPDHTSLQTSASEVLLDTGLLPVTGEYTSPVSSAVVLANPSSARQMNVWRTVTATVDVIAPADSATLVAVEERVNGGSWVNIRDCRWPEPLATGNVRAALPIPASRITTIGADDTFTIETRVRVVKTGTGASPVAVRIAVGLVLMGVTV